MATRVNRGGNRLLSLRAYARHRQRLGLAGQSLAAVQKARDSGRISVTEDGLVDWQLADRQWFERTRLVFRWARNGGR